MLHFMYAWSLRNRLVGIFSAVNESVWEHLKMAFWPAVLFMALEFLIVPRPSANLFFSGMAGILVSVSLILLAVALYTRLTKRHILFLDISIFVLSVSVGQLTNVALLGLEVLPQALNLVGMLVIGLLSIAFAAFTFRPPHLGLFQDEVTHAYGCPKTP